MSERTIKTKIVLEGEQQYRQALSSAANAVKALNAEEKAAEAQFKATGDAEAYKAEKTRILNEKLEEQQKAVKAAEEAIKKLTDNGVSRNDRAMQQWRTKLANAQTALASTQSKLNGLEKGLDNTTKAFDEGSQAAADYSATLDSIGKQISVEGAINSIDRISGTVEGAIKTVTNLGKKIIDLSKDAGQWADNVLTEAEKNDVDVVTWQAWQYASEMIDTSAADIMSATTHVQQQMVKGSKDSMEALNAINVQYSSGGKLRDANDVFWDTIDALGKMEDATDRNNRALQIFGPSYKNLIPLINKGSQAWRDAVAEGAENYALTEDQVKALGGMNDAFTKLGYSLDNTKLQILSALAPTFESVANAMAEAVNAFNAFLETKEGQELLENLGEAVGDLIKSFIGENGEGFTDIVNMAKDALNNFKNALVWLRNNKDTVVEVIKGIALAFAGIKVSQGVLTLVRLLESGKLAMSGLFGGGSAAAAGAGGGESGGGNTTVAPTGTGGGGGGGGGGSPTGTTVLPAMNGSHVIRNTGSYNYLNGAAEANYARDAAEAAGLAGTSGSVLGLNTTGLAGVGVSIAGFLGGIALLSGIAYGAGQQNKYMKQAYNPGAYADSAIRDEIEYAAYMAKHGNGEDNGANAAAALRYIAAASGSAQEFVNALNYIDTERGKANFLVDIMGGTDHEAGDDTQLKASVYRAFADVFGEIGTEAGDLAIATLDKETQEALREGAAAEAQLHAVGARRDDTSLYTYLVDFLELNGASGAKNNGNPLLQRQLEAARNGATTSTWADAEWVLGHDLNAIHEAQMAKDAEKAAEEAAKAAEDTIVDGVQEALEGWSPWEEIFPGTWGTRNEKTGLELFWDKDSGFYGWETSGNYNSYDFLPEDLDPAVVKALSHEIGVSFDTGYKEGIEEGQSTVEDAADNLGDGSLDALADAIDSHSPSREARKMGNNFGSGFVLGILDEYYEVYAAAYDLAKAAEDGFRDALDIHSPSGLMRELGGYTGEGFAEGLEESLGRISAVAGRMTGVLTQHARSMGAELEAAGIRGTAAGQVIRLGSDGVNATIYMDKRAVGYMVADTVNEVMGAKVAASRRE